MDHSPTRSELRNVASQLDTKRTGAIGGDSGGSAVAGNNPKWRPQHALL